LHDFSQLGGTLIMHYRIIQLNYCIIQPYALEQGIIIIIITIGCTAMGGPWPPQAKVASDLYNDSRPPVSTTQFSCVFLYPVNPS
jgi:hypothetical protein